MARLDSNLSGLNEPTEPRCEEDEVWLDRDLSRLGEYGPYIFEPGELESYTPIEYIPGQGFILHD